MIRVCCVICVAICLVKTMEIWLIYNSETQRIEAEYSAMDKEIDTRLGVRK
jgi:hypothetical protein